MDINWAIDLLMFNLDFPNKYFIYKVKNNDLNKEIIIGCMKDKILRNNIEVFIKDKKPNFLINILKNSDDILSGYFLEKLNDLVLDEDDFFQKEKTVNYLFFEAFANDCKNLYQKYKDIKGSYPYKLNINISRILKDLNENNIKFNVLKNCILEGPEFENKIKSLIQDEENGILLYNKLKSNFEKCQKDFSDIEIIIDYYSTFFSNNKEDMINILKKKQKEYKEDKNINELINLDIKNFFNIKNFYLNEAIEESKNIKYKNSSMFMVIYKNNYEKDKLDKSEEKILKESINDYIELIKEIIEKLEFKVPLYENKFIELIIKEILNTDFDWEKEINFIKQEFAFLNKENYINNNLKNDFLIFIEQFQFVKLIQGIIEFIEYNYRINEKKKTKSFNSLREIYNAIISNRINEENINDFINLLKSDEYYLNNGHMLITFYQSLLKNKQSIIFLQNIKDSFMNQNKNSVLNVNETKDLLDIYIFFKKILNNKEVLTDEDFLNLYNEEKEKNIKIHKSLNDLKAKFINYITNNDKENNENNIIKEFDNKNNISNKEEIINNNNAINSNQFIAQFNYNGNLINVQGNINELMNNIIDRFIIKSSLDKNSIYFLYAGTVIKGESLLSDIITRDDRERNQMNILVNSTEPRNTNINSIVKSREVICPKCFEHINIKINNYKISLSNCKNGHNINDILFKNFSKTQNLDLKKIICNNCNQNNKYDSFNNDFYKCFTCNKNLCPMCRSIHEKSHQIFNYDKSPSVCSIHFESYNSYCKNCEQNLCMKCEKDHIEHEKIYYGSILPDSEEINFKTEELKKYITQLNYDIDDIISRLTFYKENLNKYLEIYNDIMKSVESKNRNYEILNNIIELNNNDTIKDIKNIIKEKNVKNKVNLILDITEKIGIMNNDEITLIYKNKNKDKSIKIFGSEFVNNNKNMCKIICNNKEYELQEYYVIEPDKEKLVIKLKGINNITNANKMFYECTALSSIPDIKKWDLTNVIEMNEVFKGCDQSLIIPEIFKK